MVDFPASSLQIPDITELSFHQLSSSHKMILLLGKAIQNHCHCGMVPRHMITDQFHHLLTPMLGPLAAPFRIHFWNNTTFKASGRNHGRMIGEPRGLYLTETHHRKVRNTSMTWESFELAFPLLLWSNTVSASDRAATVLVGYSAVSRQVAHSIEWWDHR
jgi:hypothetical protein